MCSEWVCVCASARECIASNKIEGHWYKTAHPDNPWSADLLRRALVGLHCWANIQQHCLIHIHPKAIPPIMEIISLGFLLSAVLMDVKASESHRLHLPYEWLAMQLAIMKFHLTRTGSQSCFSSTTFVILQPSSFMMINNSCASGRVLRSW